VSPAPIVVAPSSSPAVVEGLVARTVELDVSPDLVAIGGRPGGVLWQREDQGLAGFGAAARLALPVGLDGAGDVGDVGDVGAGHAPAGGVGAVVDALAAIEIDDRLGLPGCGPVALGALPFDRGAPSSLVVPRWLVGRRGDTAWLTSIAPAGANHDDPLGTLRALEAGGPVGEPPDEFTLTSALPHAVWRRLIDDAVRRIRAGELSKVVLARKVDVAANRPFVIPDVLERLVALYPACMIFHIGGFIGASPELLVERHGSTVHSLPLAGTAARSGDLAADERLVAALVASTKDRGEHRFVTDELIRALTPVCRELHLPDVPEVLALRNVSHLATPIVGRLRGQPSPSALDLVARVHPTPAVAGTPTGAAVAHLQRVEGFDRGAFAGPVGWMDHRGDGAWALGIRSARVAGSTASLYAGVGVVADSEPDAELEETQLKLQALLAALVRP